jgi:hypothetical protein
MKICRKRLRCLLTVFIAYHILAISIGSAYPHPFRDWLYKPFQAYINAIGLKQNFVLFERAPIYDTELGAIAKFADGTAQSVSLADMQELSPLERTKQAFWANWQRSILDENYSLIRPDACRWLANKLPSKTAVQELLLYCKLKPITDPLTKQATGPPVQQVIYSSKLRQEGPSK